MTIDPLDTPAVADIRRTREQQERLVRTLAWLAPVLLIAFVASAFSVHPAPSLHGKGIVVSVTMVVFVAGVLVRNATASRPYSEVHIASVAVLLVSSVLMMWVQPNGPAAEAILLAVLCGARLLPERVAFPVLVLAFTGIEVLAALTTDANLVTLAILAAFAAFYAVMLLAFRLSEANKRAEALVAEVKHNQAALAEASVLAERQHLAREMHDVLAHSLSGLTLQLEGVRLLAAQDPTDPRLTVAIDRAHQLGKNGLLEARRAIGMLRGDELPGPDRLAGLAREFEQDRDLPCHFSVTGLERELSSEAKLTLYRVTQEALTNIAKHARPERVDLHLVYDHRTTRLTIEDFGTPSSSSSSASFDGGGGYGLTGMRERAELLGGTLAAGPTGHGFRVELEVPA